MHTGDFFRISTTLYFWHTADFAFVCILHTAYYILVKSVRTASIVSSFEYSLSSLLRVKQSDLPMKANQLFPFPPSLATAESLVAMVTGASHTHTPLLRELKELI